MKHLIWKCNKESEHFVAKNMYKTICAEFFLERMKNTNKSSWTKEAVSRTKFS